MFSDKSCKHDRINGVSLETVAQLIFIRQVAQDEMTPFGKLTEIVINNRFKAFYVNDFVSVGTDNRELITDNREPSLILSPSVFNLSSLQPDQKAPEMPGGSGPFPYTYSCPPP